MKLRLSSKQTLEPGDMVVYTVNPACGTFVITHRCIGFWGKLNGKVHISGFIQAHKGGGYREERDVYPAELTGVMPIWEKSDE